VVAGSGDAKNPAHHLDAEFIAMCLDEFIRLPDFRGRLAYRHDDYLQPRAKTLNLCSQKAGNST